MQQFKVSLQSQLCVALHQLSYDSSRVAETMLNVSPDWQQCITPLTQSSRYFQNAECPLIKKCRRFKVLKYILSPITPDNYPG